MTLLWKESEGTDQIISQSGDLSPWHLCKSRHCCASNLKHATKEECLTFRHKVKTWWMKQLWYQTRPHIYFAHSLSCKHTNTTHTHTCIHTLNKSINKLITQPCSQPNNKTSNQATSQPDIKTSKQATNQPNGKSVKKCPVPSCSVFKSSHKVRQLQSLVEPTPAPWWSLQELNNAG